MNEYLNSEYSLFERISSIIEVTRKRVATTVNTAMVYTYYEVGRYIVEDEQNGKARAEYGKTVLKDLSIRLTQKYGAGWSYANIKNIKQFYLLYSQKLNSVHPIQNKKAKYRLANSEIQTTSSEPLECEISIHPFTLSWSHYLILMRIKNDAERSFYEIECERQDWSVRQLQRQYNSSLYERLALSRNKDEVMRLANEGQAIEKSNDVVKDPLTLEFLGLRPDMIYSETKLESAIISKMRDFLLEMGKGFLFEARQKRFTFNEEHFYVDLVLYNRLLLMLLPHRFENRQTDPSRPRTNDDVCQLFRPIYKAGF